MPRPHSNYLLFCFSCIPEETALQLPDPGIWTCLAQKQASPNTQLPILQHASSKGTKPFQFCSDREPHRGFSSAQHSQPSQEQGQQQLRPLQQQQQQQQPQEQQQQQGLEELEVLQAHIEHLKQQQQPLSEQWSCPRVGRLIILASHLMQRPSPSEGSTGGCSEELLSDVLSCIRRNKGSRKAFFLLRLLRCGNPFCSFPHTQSRTIATGTGSALLCS